MQNQISYNLTNGKHYYSAASHESRAQYENSIQHMTATRRHASLLCTKIIPEDYYVKTETHCMTESKSITVYSVPCWGTKIGPIN